MHHTSLDTLGYAKDHEIEIMKHTTTPPRLALSVNEFCSSFSIGRSHFYEQVKAGRIKVLKAGKRTLVTTVEAQRWLESLSA